MAAGPSAGETQPMEEPEEIEVAEVDHERDGKRRKRRRRRAKEDEAGGCNPGCLIMVGFLLCLTGFGLILGLPLIVAAYVSPFLGDAVQKKIRDSTEMSASDDS